MGYVADEGDEDGAIDVDDRGEACERIDGHGVEDGCDRRVGVGDIMSKGDFAAEFTKVGEEERGLRLCCCGEAW